MQAVVLAAGRGTRLRPLTDDRPKALVEVAGEPILARLLDRLAGVGIAEAVVVVGYRGEQIRERFGDARGDLALTYAHQEERRGLADALLAAEEHVEGPVLEVHGDYVFGDGTDLRRVIDRHRETGAAATALVETVDRETATEVGVCEFDDDGTLVGLVEKPEDPPSRTVVTGAFALSPVVFDACRVLTPSDRGEYELTDAFDLLVHAGHRVELVAREGWGVNVNDADDLNRAARLLREDGAA